MLTGAVTGGMAGAAFYGAGRAVSALKESITKPKSRLIMDLQFFAERGETSGKYQVGAYKDIRGVKGMDAHHVGQKAVMKNFITDYDPQTAPAINIPKVGHTISGPNGIVSRSTEGMTSARQVVARDLFELKRVYSDIPNDSYKKIIDMNLKMYLEMRK